MYEIDFVSVEVFIVFMDFVYMVMFIVSMVNVGDIFSVVCLLEIFVVSYVCVDFLDW